MESNQFIIKVAGEEDIQYVHEILEEIERAAKERGTGIARRSEEYVALKMREKKVIIAFTKEGVWAGFCYIETWSNKQYVANSGLIVAKAFRKSGLARLIKSKIFSYSREQFPDAKIFGLTTGQAVMKINNELGYRPVTYSELTQDEIFWKGCESCVNYDILKSKERKNCICTAMLYHPEEHKEDSKKTDDEKLLSKFKKIKKMIWKK